MGDESLAAEYLEAANDMITSTFGSTKSVIVESGGTLDPNNASAGKTGKITTESSVDVAFYDDVSDFFSGNIQAEDRVAILAANQLSFLITTSMLLNDDGKLYKVIDIETQKIANIPIVQFLQIRA